MQGLERVLVIGPSGSGKTTLAREMSQALGCPHVELDGLFWGPHWTPRAEFGALASAAIEGDRWVVDGNYTALRALLWPRATSVVWLNYGFVTVFLRTLRRTVLRIARREQLFSGNRESFGEAFLSRKSILWWLISNYARQRRQYRAPRAGADFPRLRWYEFASSHDAERFARELRKAA